MLRQAQHRVCVRNWQVTNARNLGTAPGMADTVATICAREKRAMPTTAEKRAEFKRLHESGCFVIPNPWDVGTALYLQGMGFKALATTSAGFAWAVGAGDGGITREAGDQAHRRAVGRGLGAHERRLRGRLCRRARRRGGKRAAVRGNRRVRPVDRGLHRRQGQAALRLRPGGGAHQGGAGGHRQGRRRRAADRAQRGLHPRQARHGRDHPPAQGLFGGRRRLPLRAGACDARADFAPW